MELLTRLRRAGPRDGRLAAACVLGAGVLAGCALGGCDFLTFDDFSGESGIEVMGPPAELPARGFGVAVAGYETKVRDAAVSRILASSGAGQGIALFSAWDGGLTFGPHLFDPCDDDDECTEAGAALAGLPGWTGGASRSGCFVAVGDRSFILCEDDDLFVQLGLDTPGATEVAAVENPDPAAVAFFGAPRPPTAGAAALWRLPDGQSPIPVDLGPGRPVADGDLLGTALAATPLAGGGTLLVAGAPNAGRVILVVLEEGATEVGVAGCLDGPPGFGGAVAVGEVDGDPLPEVAAAGGGEVRIYDLEDLDASAPVGCGVGDEGDDAPRLLEVGCPPEALREPVPVSCDPSRAQFGAAVAFGDLDSDGQDELLVGAPRADVDGKIGAGAVYVFRAGGGDPVDVLVHSSPGTDDDLGRSLATVPTHLGDTELERQEVVAGMPGGGGVLVFLCSGLEGDSPGTPALGPRCVAR